jgi:C_GCAxxG_C_C family probable redox protein
MDDQPTPIIEQVRGRARTSFSSGFNCAECVADALLASVDTGLPPDVLRLATGFGGGVGLSGDTCGALLGAVMALGAVHGRSGLPEGEDRRDVIARSRRQLYEDPGLYRVFHQMPTWFRALFGHTLCRELTAQWRENWLCREHALHCRDLIAETAARAAELMLLPGDAVSSLPLDDIVEG